MVVVAGAGMGGLATAARLRELGAEVTVLEKGDRPGGSMLLSSGVVWRHRSLEEFRAECPGGDPALQAAVLERLDECLDRLESFGAPVVHRETGNPRTVGRRFDPKGLTDALVRHVGKIALEEPIVELGDETTVLATGGFGGALARRLGLPVRGNPWSDGDGLRLALGRHAALSRGMDEFYGRALPAPPARIEPEDFVRLSQVYGRHALVMDEAGSVVARGDVDWHEADLVQRIARRPGGRAWYVLDDEALRQPLSDGTVADHVEAARAAGGTVVDARDLPFEVPGSARVAVHVVASVTHTIGGLAVDVCARVLDDDGAPLANLYAVGVDAGGIAAGGYASGLAAALVLGFAAAESIRGA